jgi:hypothetical protein
MCGFILFQFLMGTHLLEMNRWCFGWHVLFNYEEKMFRLTHNSWLWTIFVHPFFIHFILPSIIVFDPFSFFIHIYFSSLDIRQNIPPYHEIFFVMCEHNIPTKIQLCSPAHVHLLTLTLTCSPNSNPQCEKMGFYFHPTISHRQHWRPIVKWKNWFHCRLIVVSVTSAWDSSNFNHWVLSTHVMAKS